MGGRGSSSGISRQEAIALHKALPSARAAETKAYRAFQSASGAVAMTPDGRNDLLAKRTKQREAAWDKYVKAAEKRESIEQKLDKYAKKKRKSIVSF